MGEVREKTVDKQGKTCIIVFVRRNTAGLCKGSTADSDSVCEGSNPSPAATEKSETVRFQTSFCIPKTTRWASGSKEAAADEEK